MNNTVPYFRLSEFFIHCSYREIFDAQKSLEVTYNIYCFICNLSKLREIYGKPIIINSCYRSSAHNIEVGGSFTSQHLVAGACDVTCDNVRDLWNHLVEFCMKSFSNECLFGQCIFYPERNFIHIGLPIARYPRFTPYVYKDGQLMKIDGSIKY